MSLIKEISGNESTEPAVEEALDSQLPESTLYLYCGDSDSGEAGFPEELGHGGYQVWCFSDEAMLGATEHERTPDAILFDLADDEDKDRQQSLVDALDAAGLASVPRIIFSSHDDIEARLDAQRLGAARYFTKPFKHAEVLPAIDCVTGRHCSQPFRILVVDDDPLMCDYHSGLLTRAGIETHCVTDPLKVWDVLRTFQPELVLMDIEMPECSGLELAAVIRQEHDFAHLPIAFISSDGSEASQAAALRAGGDCFFSKPVDLKSFSDVMTERLRRARRMLYLEQERRAASKEAERLRSALDQHNIVSVTDARGKITFVNDTFCHVSGYQRDELLGQDHSILNSGYHPRTFFQDMWRTIARGNIWHGEIRNRCKDDSYYWVKSTILPVLDEAGRLQEYISMRTDITDVKQAEIDARHAEHQLRTQQQALVEAKEEAENANRAKSQFLSSMSHELRTPMNAILGFAQLLEMEQLAQGQHESVQEISRAGQHLLELINEVLDLARIESGRVLLDLQTISIRSVLDECRSMIKPLLEKYQVSLECNYDCCLDVLVHADFTRLKQALLNVLSNGCKYNRPGGTLSVNCNIQKDGTVRIGIRDTGPGIPAEQQAEVFKPFNRLGAEHNGVEGTGIGLTITRQLIESMEGRIDVESTLGEGTTFWLEMPGEQKPDDMLTEGSCCATSASDVKAGQLRTVLYVEDNPANLRLLSRLLERRPHVELLTAHEPGLGLDLAETRHPHLIFLDINLPGMDGYEVLRRIRNLKGGDRVPVIAISAHAMPADIERGMAAGFNDYLTKPFEVEKFLGVVDRHLQMKSVG